VFGPGVVVVEPEDELAFLHRLPVGALWGVGPATKARLERLAVRTVGDLAALSEDAVVAALGTSQGRHLHALAWARDERTVVPDAKAKSIGHEETFAKDHHTHATLERELLRLGDAVATRLRKAGVSGRTVQLKVRFSHDFQTITRAETVPEGIDEVTALVRVGRRLLAGIDPSPGVRLLGISVSQLTEGAARQLTFDDAEAPGWTGATQAIDEIRERFGDAAIGPAALAARLPKRRGDAQWGPGT
jgi:DNA polymerase-4